MNRLYYQKLKDGRWQVYDHDGHTAEGYSKEEAKRLYFLYYQMSYITYDGKIRKGLIPTEELTLDTN